MGVAASDVAAVDVLVVGGTFREVIERQRAEPNARLAGSGLTAAVAAARMGATVAFASFVGEEDEDAARTLLTHAGVRPELIVAAGASGTFVYPADDDDTNPQPLYRPAETSPVELPPLGPATSLLLFGMPDFDTPRSAAVIAAAQGAQVVLWDRQGWLSRTRDASAASKLESSKRLLLANVDEAMDERIIDPDSGAVTLPAGFDAAVLKDGRRGVLVVDARGNRTEIPAYLVEVSSNVGSGDIFAGVLAAEVSTGAQLEDAARLAAAGASAMLRTGDTLAPPDLRELARAVTRESGCMDWRW
jgi:sugar/nucleoside kinase (ribokinase family)